MHESIVVIRGASQSERTQTGEDLQEAERRTNATMRRPIEADEERLGCVVRGTLARRSDRR
ncbi:MAG: hypothetical protein U0794_20040 [Isosphaeraceae bacterium]